MRCEHCNTDITENAWVIPPLNFEWSGTRRYLCEPCYRKASCRLGEFAVRLMGTEEEFEAWLGDELPTEIQAQLSNK